MKVISFCFSVVAYFYSSFIPSKVYVLHFQNKIIAVINIKI